MPTTDHDRLLAKIARQYYEHELTQSKISQRLRLSRQKVQRPLPEVVVLETSAYDDREPGTSEVGQGRWRSAAGRSSHPQGADRGRQQGGLRGEGAGEEVLLTIMYRKECHVDTIEMLRFAQHDTRSYLAVSSVILSVSEESPRYTSGFHC